MELIIKDFKTTDVIEFNYEELKKELADRLVKYQSATYDDSAISLAKKDRAALNNLKTAIEDRRKEIKKQCLEPYELFEMKIKDIVGMIDKPILQIDTQVKAYEQKVKDDKKAEIEKLFNDNIDDLEGIIGLYEIFNPKWLNVTYSMRNISNEIDSSLKKVREDLTVINGLQSEFDIELKNIYLNSMDLSEVLRKKAELEERKQRLEQMQAEKERAKLMQQSPIKTVETDIKTVAPAEMEMEQLYEVTFKVLGTREQISALKQFMIVNKIKYGNGGNGNGSK